MEVSSSTEIIAQHLAALRKRLIDISNRNKVVSFRPTKKACIEVAFPKISELHDQLTEGEEELRLQLGVEYLVDDTRSKQKRPGARVNEIEAEIVARTALDHLMENPSETLLVATFNRPQQELIDALVDKYAAEDEAMLERLEEARQHAKEPFAVKNLENVQGDERNVIYVSCTYGADLNSGQVMQRFGPVAGAGGRRRFTLFAVNRNFHVALPLLAGAGFGMMLFLPTSNSALQTSVPDEMRGRVMGVWALIFGGMMPFGSLEAGVLARIVGVPATMIIGAAICAVAAAVTLIVIHRREQAIGRAHLPEVA